MVGSILAGIFVRLDRNGILQGSAPLAGKVAEKERTNVPGNTGEGSVLEVEVPESQALRFGCVQK